jgi:hypothetical protein
VLPFSFLIELRNINFTNRLNIFLIRWSARFLLLLMPCFIAYTLLNSIFTLKLTLAIFTCDFLTLCCLIHIVLFYINEISEMIRINRDDRNFVAESTRYNRKISNKLIHNFSTLQLFNFTTILKISPLQHLPRYHNLLYL